MALLRFLMTFTEFSALLAIRVRRQDCEDARTNRSRLATPERELILAREEYF